MPNLVFFLSDGVMELLCMRYLLQVRNRINLRGSSLTKRTLLCKEAGRSHLTGMYHNSEHPNHREYQKQVQLIKRTVKFFLTLAFQRQILLLITEFPLFCIEFFLQEEFLIQRWTEKLSHRCFRKVTECPGHRIQIQNCKLMSAFFCCLLCN